MLEKNLTVVQGGVTRELTIDEALQQKTYQEAIAGNRPARREILRMIAKREKVLAERPPVRKSVELVTEGPDPENANQALLILGVAARDQSWAHTNRAGDRFLLEPWAVHAAVSRLRGRRLSARDIDDVRRSTRDGKALSLPAPSEP